MQSPRPASRGLSRPSFHPPLASAAPARDRARTRTPYPHPRAGWGAGQRGSGRPRVLGGWGAAGPPRPVLPHSGRPRSRRPPPPGGPTRSGRPPSTYPEGVGAIGAAEAAELHAAGGRADGPGGRRLLAAATAAATGGREAAAEGAGAATPPGWPARHGDAAPRPAPPRRPAPAPCSPAAAGRGEVALRPSAPCQSPPALQLGGGPGGGACPPGAAGTSAAGPCHPFSSPAVAATTTATVRVTPGETGFRAPGQPQRVPKGSAAS